MRSTALALTCAALVTVVPAMTSAADAARGPTEGITVHGHWRIEVLDPDGTLVSTTELENALVEFGAQTLVNSLTGLGVVGGWLVVLYDTTGAQLPCDDGSGASHCNIGESDVDYGTIPLHSSDLTVTRSLPWTFSLAGSVTVAYSTSIDRVGTITKVCDPSNTAASCRPATGFSYAGFTGKDLTPAVPVQPGQIVNVTVNLSFS